MDKKKKGLDEMEWVSQFDELKSSALKELANIGISHVATAIGEILGKQIDISLPDMSNFYKSQLVASGTNGMVAAYLTVEGISECTEILIVLSKNDALALMNKFINCEGLEKTEASSLSLENQKCIFGEIVSIIACTYFSAVDSMFSLKTNCEIPLVSFGDDEFSEFITNTLKLNEGISINTSFSTDKKQLNGNFMLMPDPKSVDVFFRAIGLVS
ncbi:MAG: chemotaxis protein CheC [Candidatus Omnitrophica bacterium]|nr:chemotaxis protein CheC [Candidatus Omnitrophota bacterium]